MNQQPDLVSDAKHSREAARMCFPVRQEVIHQEKWLSLERAHYQTPKGERSWEMIRRNHKSANGGDGAIIIATLRRALHYDCLVLVKQYRPPLEKYSIEFPAGMIDANEEASSTALRELKEETGYTGTVHKVSPGVSLDAGTSSSTVHMVHVDIDGDEPNNIHPKQDLDEDEFIEVLVVPVNRLEKLVQEWSQEENVVIDSRLYVYATCQPARKTSTNQVDILSRKLDN